MPDSPSSAANKRAAPLPSVRSALLERLAAHPPRQCDTERLSQRPDHPAQVMFSTSGERATLAAALLLFQSMHRAGGVCLDKERSDRLLSRVLSGMSEEERVEAEIEVYEILEWVLSAFEPAAARHANVPRVVSLQSSHEEVARWAIHQGEDLTLEYYDRQVGALIRHTITPMALEASNYLRAISHTTKDERVFSLKQVGALEPAHGWVMGHSEGGRATLPEEARIGSAKPPQMSWLDEVSAPHDDEDEEP